MAKQFNTSANFSNIANTQFDSGLKLLNPACLAYNLNEANDATTITDVSNTGINGTRSTNLTQVSGRFAGTFATQGNGTNNATTAWNATKFTGDFTIDVRYKPSTADIAASDRHILGCFGSSGTRTFLIALNNGKINFITSVSGSNGILTNNTEVLVADTWYNIRVSHSTTSGTSISLGGVEKGTNATSGSLFSGSKPLAFFGMDDYTSGFPITGTLVDFVFYDEVKSANYTPDENYYYPYSGESLIHDSGSLCSDSDAGFAFDNSTALETATGLTVEYQYADYASAQSWSTANQVNDNADWNGSWLTLAQIQALSDSMFRIYRYFKTRITGVGSLTAYSIDLAALDITAPSDVSATANSALSGAGETYDLIATFTGGTDTGGSGYKGANLEIEESSVSYFQQSDGTFLADETFANLLFKGDANERGIIYALGRSTVPTRFRINAWDEAGNYNRGDWATFSELDFPEPENVLTIDTTNNVAGTYNATELIPSTVKALINFDVSSIGTYTGGATPDVTTLSIVNNEDGTATATIAGSSAGVTNTLYIAKYGTAAWTPAGSRSGDGDITITDSNGSYWAYNQSELGTCTSSSVVQIFRITDGEDAVIVGIAEQIKDIINGSTVAPSTTAERVYFSHERLEKINTTEIWIQPNETRIEEVTRTQDSIEYDIDISIFKKSKTTAETDDLILLSDQVYDLLKRVELDTLTVSSVREPTMFSLDDLVQNNLFVSVMTITVKDIN